MKYYFFIFLSTIFCTVNGQSYKTISVINQEDKSVISNARITSGNQVFYTNDDGKVNIPSELKNIEVFAPSYERSNHNSLVEIIALKPLYKEIQEVEITNVDIKQIFQNTLKNYSNIYYNKPSLYNGTIRQKGYVDGNLINLLVANINIWSLFNFYNFKAQNDTDSFVQINLDDIKYYKTKKLSDDYPFNTDVQIVPKDFIQKLFLNSELVGVLNDTKDIKLGTKLLYENKNVQHLHFGGKKGNIDYNGMVIYNKKEGAISFFDVTVSNYESKHTSKNKNGEEYDVITNSFNISYDFYKKNNQYIPSLIKTKASGYGLYRGKEMPFSFIQEIILSDMKDVNKKGLKSKIDLSKNLTDNIPTKEIKENNTLLSKEEQKFVNEP